MLLYDFLLYIRRNPDPKLELQAYAYKTQTLWFSKNTDSDSDLLLCMIPKLQRPSDPFLSGQMRLPHCN